MADITQALAHHNSALHWIGAPFRAILRAMVATAEADPRLKQIDRLKALSDADLAKRGLTRDEIVRHVFRHHLVY